MTSNKQIINSFLDDNYDNSNLLGVIFYGSRKYGNYHNDSDIDLLIISKEDNNYKGLSNVNNIRVEYFQKNLYYILSKLEGIEYSLDRSLISIFKNGEIIFSKDECIEALKDEFLSKNDFSRRNKKKFDCNIYSWLNALYNCHDNDFYKYIYSNLIERIRKTYHIQHGYSKISHSKSIELYQNKDYAKKYYCVNLPKQEFITKFLLSLNNDSEENLGILLKTVNYDEKESTVINTFNTNIINYRSTVISTGILELCSIKDTKLFEYNYYLLLEKIRTLYCDKNRIDNDISNFMAIQDDYFMQLFQKCLKDKSIESINVLFEYVTKSLRLNYNNYKILDLKR